MKLMVMNRQRSLWLERKILPGIVQGSAEGHHVRAQTAADRSKVIEGRVFVYFALQFVISEKQAGTHVRASTSVSWAGTHYLAV
jgi:hypothetical protein